jgi:hypothetical protein
MTPQPRAPAPPERAADEESPEAGRDPTAPAHDDWLLDESLAETFPASDPIAPARHKDPGGT